MLDIKKELTKNKHFTSKHYTHTTFTIQTLFSKESITFNQLQKDKIKLKKDKITDKKIKHEIKKIF